MALARHQRLDVGALAVSYRGFACAPNRRESAAAGLRCAGVIGGVRASSRRGACRRGGRNEQSDCEIGGGHELALSNEVTA